MSSSCSGGNQCPAGEGEQLRAARIAAGRVSNLAALTRSPQDPPYGPQCTPPNYTPIGVTIPLGQHSHSCTNNQAASWPLPYPIAMLSSLALPLKLTHNVSTQQNGHLLFQWAWVRKKTPLIGPTFPFLMYLALYIIIICRMKKSSKEPNLAQMVWCHFGPESSSLLTLTSCLNL